jgi:hypothetical protein
LDWVGKFTLLRRTALYFWNAEGFEVFDSAKEPSTTSILDDGVNTTPAGALKPNKSFLRSSKAAVRL